VNNEQRAVNGEGYKIVKKITGAQILVETLIENGVDTIFGYPGGAVLNIYDELYKNKNKIRHILVSHEQHAAHAADGYARSTGKTGVCITTSGPGATNLVTGIATAFVDSVPMVVITGNVGKALLGKDSFQEVDIAGITMPIVKHNWIVKDAGELAQVIKEAFIVAQSGRPGPVLIDIPKDISSQELENYNESDINNECVLQRKLRLINRTERKTFSEDDIENVSLLIKNSRRPMIFAGGGVNISGANKELLKFAELINAPVALSLMGMGSFPCEHRLCTGLIGMHGTAASNKAVQKSDLLIAAGTRFSDRVTSSIERFAGKSKIIHIDIDPAEINKNINTDAFIIGDIKTVLGSLIKKTQARTCDEWNNEINKWKADIPKAYLRKVKLHPGFIIKETAKKMGDDAIVVTDTGQHQIWTAQFYPFRNPRTFLSSGGMGTMGYGLGAAIGAKIANPHRPIVLFTGDGSFRMNCAEMASLIKYKLPVLIVIFNNHSLGMLRQWQNFFYSANYFETSLETCGPDFIKLADAYNVQGFRVTDHASFLDALDKGLSRLSSGLPVLIEAIIGKDEHVVPMTPGGKAVDEQIK